jgi:hypothetical protein
MVSTPTWSRDGASARLRLKSPGPFPPQDIPDLLVSVSFDSNTRVRVRITDANATRWEPPDIVRSASCGNSPCGAADPLLLVSFAADPFGFAVTRRDDGSVIFNSSATDVPQPCSTLVYSDQFISLSSSLPPSAKVYGLGEQIAPLNLPVAGPAGQKYTLFANITKERLNTAPPAAPKRTVLTRLCWWGMRRAEHTA